jgi:uncharacterized membrane protein YadS
MAAVAPIRRAERTAIARTICLTTVVGVVMVVLLPAAVPLWGLRHEQDGIVAGMAASVVREPFEATRAVTASMVTGLADHAVFGPRSVSTLRSGTVTPREKETS